MDAAQQMVADFGGLLQSGFYKVNAIQGLVIALLAAVVMTKWARLFVLAFVAVLAHVVIDMTLPLLSGGSFRLPPVVELGYWQYIGTLYLGYVVVIAMFFLIKKVLLRR